MEFIIATILFVVLVGAWVILPGAYKPHAAVTPAETPETRTAAQTA